MRHDCLEFAGKKCNTNQVLLLHDYVHMRNCFLQILSHKLKNTNPLKLLKCLPNAAFDISVRSLQFTYLCVSLK